MCFVRQSVSLRKSERGVDSNMKKFTGLTSEPPLPCQSSERGADFRGSDSELNPDQKDLGAGTPTNPEKDLVENE